jgi:hypothetical protein
MASEMIPARFDPPRFWKILPPYAKVRLSDRILLKWRTGFAWGSPANLVGLYVRDLNLPTAIRETWRR